MAQPIATIGAAATANAERFGERLALVDDYRSATFQTFADRAAALQHALRANGVQPGDRVAFLSKNRIECLEIFMASDMGAIIVPINWRLRPDEIAYILEDCTPTVFIAEDPFLDDIRSIVASAPSIKVRAALGDEAPENWLAYDTFLADDGTQRLPDKPPQTSDAACIVYTSGTTGRPKGVVLSHAALLASSDRIVGQMLKLGPDDITLAVMPLFHVGGMWFHCFPSFMAGALTRLQSAFRPDEVLEAICEDRTTNVHLAPTMVADLLNRPATEQAAASLQTIFYAASPMPHEILAQAMAQFPNTSFFQSYGSTEAGTVCWLGPDAHKAGQPNQEDILNSCGKPFEAVDVKLRHNEPRGSSSDAVGEILVRSTGTMSGYWQNDEATRETLQDGWVATGDLGRQDEAGYLTIVDRKKDMIISGGENVYPAEVEDVLHACPGVAAAAVFGVPDNRWVERVVACVVAAEGADISERGVITWTKGRLSSYKCPKEIHILDVLPKNAAGKVLKRELKDAYPFAVSKP